MLELSKQKKNKGEFPRDPELQRETNRHGGEKGSGEAEGKTVFG